jgi:hypothetical protein
MLGFIPVGLLLIVPFIRNTKARYFVVLICVIAWVAFFFARVYLVVESFVSMRALPRSAFDGVELSEAMPHV